MALAELCGLDTQFKFNLRKNIVPVEYDIAQYTGNLYDSCQLAVPPYLNPAETLASLQQDEFGNDLRMHFDHGTTTLGFRYQGGILLAVDSRATGGSFIGSSDVKKIIELNDYLLATMAGGAADCVYWDRVLAKHCRMYELRNRERISIAAASKLMSNMIYNYKGMGLSIGSMITGWDKRGPSLYYIDSEGTRSKGDCFSVGSGSVHAFGVLDSGYHWDLTNEEAYDLGRRSIYHATFRDVGSGGNIRVYHVTEKGWTKISVDDCSDLHFKYEDERKAETA